MPTVKDRGNSTTYHEIESRGGCVSFFKTGARSLQSSRRLRPSADSGGAAVRSRTSNLLIRSQMLYPIELRLHSRIAGGGEKHRWKDVATFSAATFSRGIARKDGAGLRGKHSQRKTPEKCRARFQAAPFPTAGRTVHSFAGIAAPRFDRADRTRLFLRRDGISGLPVSHQNACHEYFTR